MTKYSLIVTDKKIHIEPDLAVVRATLDWLDMKLACLNAERNLFESFSSSTRIAKNGKVTLKIGGSFNQNDIIRHANGAARVAYTNRISQRSLVLGQLQKDLSQGKIPEKERNDAKSRVKELEGDIAQARKAFETLKANSEIFTQDVRRVLPAEVQITESIEVE